MVTNFSVGMCWIEQMHFVHKGMAQLKRWCRAYYLGANNPLPFLTVYRTRVHEFVPSLFELSIVTQLLALLFFAYSLFTVSDILNDALMLESCFS